MPAANDIAISFEVGDIAHAVSGIDSLASSMQRLGQSSGGALMPVQNPFEGLMTGMTALPGALGKAALGLKAFTEGLITFANVANESAQRQLDFGSTRNFLGSSGQTTAIAEGLGKAVGVDAAALAQSLRDTAFSSPGAAEAMSKLRYPYVPSPGPMDTGQALLDVIKELRDLYRNSPEEASRLARNWNPALLKFLSIPEDAFQAFSRFGSGRIGKFSNEAEGAAAAAALRMQMLKEGATDAIFGNPGLGKGGGIPGLPGWMGAGAGAGGAGNRIEQQHAALKQNTQAIQDNTEQLSKVNGIYGGGSRLRSAIPRHWQGRGDQFDDAMSAPKAKFGAYSVTF